MSNADDIRRRIGNLKSVSWDDCDASHIKGALLKVLEMLADEVERIDNSTKDDGIQFGGPIDFPKQP